MGNVDFYIVRKAHKTG